MNKAVVEEKAEHSIQRGHPWVFSGKVLSIETKENNPVVSVYSRDNRFLCKAYYNPDTSIALRVLTRDKTEINKDFFYKRIYRSLNRRICLGINRHTDSFRVVNGESDRLPGLIIDKYADTIVVQIHTLGIDFFKGVIIDIIDDIFKPETIYEKSENLSICTEGPGKRKGTLAGKIPGSFILIRENGLNYAVDIVNGQKTGFFLDQRDNRARIRYFAKRRRVLNLFSYTCSFGLNSIAGGAESVVNVDISESALELGSYNNKLNGFPDASCIFRRSDAFEYLKEEKNSYDLIILDPPAFIKSRKDIKRGMAAYKQINSLAVDRLEKNGVLMTSSCSSLLKKDEFEKLICSLTGYKDKAFQIIGYYGQPADHPVISSFNEGHYLKSLFLMRI